MPVSRIRLTPFAVLDPGGCRNSAAGLPLQDRRKLGQTRPVIAFAAPHRLWRTALKTSAAVIGFILGIAMVWWVRPDNNAGAVFLVVATTAVCFAASLLMGLFRKT
jgi:hypothetical protein